jgi:GntR family transcriptional regulator/MocR family aminotransferase
MLPGSLFSESHRTVNAIRLGFGSLSDTELEKGIAAMKEAFQRAKNL